LNVFCCLFFADFGIPDAICQSIRFDMFTEDQRRLWFTIPAFGANSVLWLVLEKCPATGVNMVLSAFIFFINVMISISTIPVRIT